MQNIVCDCRIDFGWFHEILLFQGWRAAAVRQLSLYRIVSFNTAR
jgi:hypothetical protein